MLISIIVPVFNASEYLKYCLDSCLNQTIRNEFELVLIDDGSKDDSASIIKEYQKRYTNIVFKQQKNSGASSARNLGLSIAQGEYILFLDSDDLLEVGILSKLENIIESNSFDIMVGNWVNLQDNEEKPSILFHGFVDNLANLIVKPPVISAVIFRKNNKQWDETLQVNEVFKYFFSFFPQQKIHFTNLTFTKIRQHSSSDRISNSFNHFEPKSRFEIYQELYNYLNGINRNNLETKSALAFKLLGYTYQILKADENVGKEFAEKIAFNDLLHLPKTLNSTIVMISQHLKKRGLLLFFKTNKRLKRL